jgi:hypothetical protein
MMRIIAYNETLIKEGFMRKMWYCVAVLGLAALVLSGCGGAKGTVKKHILEPAFKNKKAEPQAAEKLFSLLTSDNKLIVEGNSLTSRSEILELVVKAAKSYSIGGTSKFGNMTTVNVEFDVDGRKIPMKFDVVEQNGKWNIVDFYIP